MMKRSLRIVGVLISTALLTIFLTACGSGGGDENPTNDTSADNQAPAANAGPNQVVTSGAAVTLDGTGSTDSDGSITSYAWTQTEGTTVSLADAATSSANFTAPVVSAQETLSFQLTVTDNEGETATATVTVAVSPVSAGNQAPVADAGTDQTVDADALITLDGRGSMDGEGDTLTYSWLFSSTPLGSNATLSNLYSVEPTFTADLPGSYVVELVVNDGQEDSKPDFVLIVADLGTFSKSVLSSSTATSGGVAVGDFNRDKHLDIALGSYDPYQSGSTNGFVSVLLGDGSGSFSAPSFYASGSVPPRRLTTGDFNKDGFIDIAGTNEGFSGAPENTVSILFGDGSGGFSGPSSVYVGDSPRPIVAEDFNQDGIIDLAVGLAYYNSPGGVEILLNDGTGGFSAPNNFADESGFMFRNTTSISEGDFNSDGIPDLALGHNGNHGMSILIGNGEGEFFPLDPISVSGIITSTIGDFNGDSHIDLAASRAITSETPRQDVVSIYLGDGSGTFQFNSDFSTANSVISIVVGDFNGDTFLDLAQSSGESALSILFGDGTGSFFGPFNFGLGDDSYFPYAGAVVVGDFNEDGFPDTAVGHSGGVSIFLWVP